MDGMRARRGLEVRARRPLRRPRATPSSVCDSSREIHVPLARCTARDARELGELLRPQGADHAAAMHGQARVGHSTATFTTKARASARRSPIGPSTASMGPPFNRWKRAESLTACPIRTRVLGVDATPAVADGVCGAGLVSLRPSAGHDLAGFAQRSMGNFFPLTRSPRLFGA
jgi:hypothetical protein